MGDNDFPAVMPNAGFLQQYVKGMQGYSQKGTDIPALRLESEYQQQEGGPLFEKQTIAGSPSFNIAPDIDSPSVDRWIKEVRSQPGYQAPKFLSPDQMRQRVLELDKRMRGLGA